MPKPVRENTQNLGGPDPFWRGVAGSRASEEPGGPWAQYMYRYILALTCPLNGQFESGIDRYSRSDRNDWFDRALKEHDQAT